MIYSSQFLKNYNHIHVTLNNMAIYGIGAFYRDKDVSKEFIQNGVACIGWTNQEAPSLYGVLRQVKLGDIFYIKSFNPKSGLYIKGVGIVTDNTIKEIEGLGSGVEVRWLWTDNELIGKLDDKYNVKNNTIYEEFDIQIQKRVIDLMTV